MKKIKSVILGLSVLLLSFGCKNTAFLSDEFADEASVSRSVSSDTPYFEIKADSSATWSQSGKFQFQIAKSVSSGKTVSFDFVPPSGTTSVTVRGAGTDTKWINGKSLSSFTKSGSWYSASFTTTSSDSSIGVTFYTSGNSSSQYVRIANLKIAGSTAESSTSIFQPYSSTPSALSVKYVKPSSGSSTSSSKYIKVSTSSSATWSQTGKFQFMMDKEISKGSTVSFKFVPPANTTSVTIRGVSTDTKFISGKELASFSKSGDWYSASFTVSSSKESESGIGFTFYVSSISTSQTVKISDFKINGKRIKDGVIGGALVPYSSSPSVIKAVSSENTTLSNPVTLPTSSKTPIKWAGIRCSTTSGYATYSDSKKWGETCLTINKRFKNESPRPVAIWIVNEIHGETTSSPHIELYFTPSAEDDPKFPSDTEYNSEDMNEAFLKYADEHGIDVWLQVQSGNVDIFDLESVVLDRYKHHPCVKGFGVDIEYYHCYRVTENDNYYGIPVTDEVAERLVRTARFYNENYTVFLKHWEEKKMPSTVRDGLIFVNDSQGLHSISNAKSEFKEWMNLYPNNPILFQIGYKEDKSGIWGKYSDPVREFGLAVTEGSSNSRQYGIVWVDFTLKDVLKKY